MSDRLIGPAILVLALAALSGCVGTTALSQLAQTRPIGGPFSQALFKNYALLAQSFGTVGTPSSGTPFDADNSISLGSMSSSVADIANTYAEKALVTAQGDEILPEESNAALKQSEDYRLQLLRDLDQGRERAPEDAARAQADYDCWIINARANELRRASQQCRRSLAYTLAQLERDLSIPAPAPGPTQPTPAEPAPAASPPPAPTQ
jgi:OOP family OmpA-OmpF porin